MNLKVCFSEISNDKILKLYYVILGTLGNINWLILIIYLIYFII